MTVAEANTIMQPATAATTIRVDTGSRGGSCNYEYSAFHAIVSVLFRLYVAGVSLDAIATQALAQAQQNGATITKTTVTGIGDQALYITASYTVASTNVYAYYLDTTVGSLYVSCWNTFLGAPPATSQQPALTPVCTQVLSRL